MALCDFWYVTPKKNNYLLTYLLADRPVSTTVTLQKCNAIWTRLTNVFGTYEISWWQTVKDFLLQRFSYIVPKFNWLMFAYPQPLCKSSHRLVTRRSRNVIRVIQTLNNMFRRFWKCTCTSKIWRSWYPPSKNRSGNYEVSLHRSLVHDSRVAELAYDVHADPVSRSWRVHARSHVTRESTKLCRMFERGSDLKRDVPGRVCPPVDIENLTNNLQELGNGAR